MRDLQASLRDHPMAMLRVIAEMNGIELATNVREDACAQVAETLRAPETVADALRRSSSEAQAAWVALLQAGGQIKAPAFARRFGALRPIGPGKLEREMLWRAPANAAEELWYRGLIYRGFAELSGGLAEYFYIPDDLQQDLPAPPPATAAGPSLVPIADELAPDAVRLAPPLAIDAATLLAEVAATPLRLDAGGAWRNSDEAHLRELLLLPDPVRLAMLFVLAQDLGWLAPADAPGGRVAVNGEPVGQWLRGTVWDQRTALFNAWRNSVEWNDLRRLPSLRAEGEWRNDTRLAREAVLAVLARLEPGAWYRVADIVAGLKEHNPDFQRPDGNYGGWYLRDVATGRYLSGFESWDEVEGRLIYFLVTEPLYWLGAVELGRIEDGHSEVVSLSPEGAAWIGGQMPPEMPAPARLQVNEDFTLVAPLTLPLIDRYRLLRFTEPVAPLPQPGQPTVHRITRRSLAAARKGGLKADRILQFLRHATGGRVPERIETALQRWEQHGGTVRVTRGALLRVEDAGILSTLRADPALAPLLGELISAQAVMVSSANLPRLLAALNELGYATQVEG